MVRCYSCTNISNENHIKDFSATLIGLVKKIPNHHVCIIRGDMNKNIGKRNTEESHTMIIPTQITNIFRVSRGLSTTSKRRQN